MSSSLLDWLRHRAPGAEEVIADELRIRHGRRGVSSLWYRSDPIIVPPALRPLQLYETFDGADLFSSTFKVASIASGRVRGDVEIVPSLASLEADALREGAEIPTGATPFMVQAGIGIYSVAPSGRIYEWDSELGEISGEYGDVLAILDEWWGAMTAA